MDMSIWYRQKPSESLPTWLLHLWDMGVENTVMLGPEMSGLASLTTHPSLWQQLQSAHHASGNQTLLEWLTVPLGQFGLITSWKIYVELQQVLQELGMKSSIYDMDAQGPSEELFTIGIRNLVLHTAPHLSLGP